MSSDQIAYLRDLANSYFQEGNLSASISTWEQVLSMDPSNVEARQGITLAQMKLEGVSPPTSSSAPDPDATMMFQIGETAGFGAPAAPAAPGSGFDAERTMMFGGTPQPPAAPGGGFDAERTMIFGSGPSPAAPAPQPAAGGPGGGFDAERTMMFQPGASGVQGPATPPAAAPPAGGFDAERTMMFQPGPPAPPPAVPPAAGGFEPDRTMVFNPSLAPPAAAPQAPAPPAWQPPAAPQPPAPPAWQPPEAPQQPPAPAAWQPPGTPQAPAWQPPVVPSGVPASGSSGADWLKPPGSPVPDADSTMMSAPSGSDFGAPMSPPSPFPLPPSAGGGGGRALEDFSLPSAPPDFSAPPGVGGAAGPPPPGGSTGGFSFELPPPPAQGGGRGLPDLPSVGFSSPPPAFTPTPPPPPMPAGPPKKAGGQFGEVDPGEIESLSVPTVAPTAPAPSDSARQQREDQLKQEYEKQYGRSPAQQPPPRPALAPSRPSVSPKFLVGLLLALVIVLGAGYAGIQWWQGRQEPVFTPPPPPKDPEEGLTKEAAEALMSQKLVAADNAQRAGNLADAERFINEARDIALKNNIEVPQRIIEKDNEIEREMQYQESFQKAVTAFCVEDYPRAHAMLLDLERLRPDKKEAGQYIERIFWNLGIEKLQTMEPWEARDYLDSLVQRNPADAQAADLLAYARQYQPGANLGDAYLRRVDPLSMRMAGCQ